MRVRSVRYSACAYASAVDADHRSVILTAEAFALRPTSAVSDQEGMQVKGSQKPKKLGKKPAQKTLKERRTEKRAAAKHASRGLDV
jgi:hypothetical protein